MTANRRSVRKRRSKHKGSMKIITLIVLVLCGVFGVFTWQNTQKSEQYALVQENLQQQIDDEEENQQRQCQVLCFLLQAVMIKTVTMMSG